MATVVAQPDRPVPADQLSRETYAIGSARDSPRIVPNAAELRSRRWPWSWPRRATSIGLRRSVRRGAPRRARPPAAPRPLPAPPVPVRWVTVDGDSSRLGFLTRSKLLFEDFFGRSPFAFRSPVWCPLGPPALDELERLGYRADCSSTPPTPLLRDTNTVRIAATTHELIRLTETCHRLTMTEAALWASTRESQTRLEERFRTSAGSRSRLPSPANVSGALP